MKRALSRPKVLAMAAVLAVHGLLIIAVNNLAPVDVPRSERALVLKILPPNKPVAVEAVQQAPLQLRWNTTSPKLVAPEFSIAAPEGSRAINSAGIYEGAGHSAASQHTPPAESSAIFDPRLRQRVEHLQERAKPASKGDLPGWVAPSGRQHVDMGDGTCIHTMEKIAGERQAQWSTTRSRCGKNKADIMLENLRQNLGAAN